MGRTPDLPLPFFSCEQLCSDTSPGAPDEDQKVCRIVFGYKNLKITGSLDFSGVDAYSAFLGDYTTVPADAKPIELYPPKELLSCAVHDTTAYCKAVSELPPPAKEVTPCGVISFAFGAGQQTISKFYFSVKKNPDNPLGYDAYYSYKLPLTENDKAYIIDGSALGTNSGPDGILPQDAQSVVIPPPVEAFGSCDAVADYCTAVPVMTAGDPDPVEPEDPDEKIDFCTVFFGTPNKGSYDALGFRYKDSHAEYYVLDRANVVELYPLLAFYGDHAIVPADASPIILPPPKELALVQDSLCLTLYQAYCESLIPEISDYCAIGFGTPGQKPVHTLLYRNGTYAVDPSKVTEEVFKKAFVIGG